MRHRHVAAAMMNVVAIGLLLSTLAAAGIWSPAPPEQPPAGPHHGGDHVVREGRRVVIVEYERELPLSAEDGAGRSVKVKETRVLPPDALDGVDDLGHDGGTVFDDEASGGVVSDAAGKVAGAAAEGKERLSDAKGGVLGAVKRCKDRLCGAGRKVEEGAMDAASRVEHGAEDAARAAMETVSDAKDSAENKAFDAAQKGKEAVRSAKDRASDAVGSAKEKASDVAHQGKETVKSAKDRVAEAAGKAKEKASAIQHGAAGAAKAAKERVSDAARHAKNTVSDIAQRAEDCAEDAAERAADAAAEAEEEAKARAAEVGKNLTDIARRARGVASDAAAYLLFLGNGGAREAARTATAVMHLLGFATAYGACVWVTFVSSHVLAAALPRQQLGMVQSKLFPVYFRAVAYGVALALASHLLGGRERRSSASRAQSLNLLAALGLVLANMLLLEPKATKAMFERMKVEKEEGRGRDMADTADPPVVTVATPTAGAGATTTVVPTAAAAARAGTGPAVDGAGTCKQARPAETSSKSRAVSRRLKQLNGYSSLCNVLSLMSLTWHLVHLARRLHAGTAC